LFLQNLAWLRIPGSSGLSHHQHRQEELVARLETLEEALKTQEKGRGYGTY